jgi:hypothetical protein
VSVDLGQSPKISQRCIVVCWLATRAGMPHSTINTIRINFGEEWILASELAR